MLFIDKLYFILQNLAKIFHPLKLNSHFHRVPRTIALDKMQYSIQSELDNIAESNNDVADITSLSSCLVRNTLSEDDIIHLLDERVELSLLWQYFETFCNTYLYFYYATARDDIPSTDMEATVCMNRRNCFISYNSIVFAFLRILIQFMQSMLFMTVHTYIAQYLWILCIHVRYLRLLIKYSSVYFF